MGDHFDAALGGNQMVPNFINTKQFAEARVTEILALNDALEQAEKGRLIFQRLPKGMRRRVMAHHSKRMPRRLQEVHAKQLEKNGAPQKTKCPSRKHRRKPSNMLLEYNRRQKKFIWLETHIWHAKRFRMSEKWNYKLAESSYAKVFRTCYHASANHCLLQDISYYCCIEICGPEDKLIEGLKLHTNDTVSLTFGAQAFLSGCKEGIVTFFHKNMYPFGAIGVISFLWKAEDDSYNADKRTLWLWTHPAVYSEITDCLLETFALCKELQTNNVSGGSEYQLNEVEAKKLETHRVFEPLPSYNNNATNICVTLLKDKLNRFRLTGPLSHSILVDSLNVTSLIQVNKVPGELKNKEMKVLESHKNIENHLGGRENGVDKNKKDNKEKPENLKAWWKCYYKSSDFRKEIHNSQNKFWLSMRGIYSPAQIPPHQVVALTVLDPRYQLPAKRTKSVPDSNGVLNPEVYTNFTKDISISPIWSSEVRMSSISSKLSNSEWTKQREQMVLVPGFSETEINSAKELNLHTSHDFEPSYIPVLLVQRPGCQDPSMKRLGYSSGWDIIMPASWAMPFWMAFIFRGARPGGLKEASTVGFEAGTIALTERLAPDTAAGKAEAEVNKQHIKDQYFRLPPNKRPNFIKLGIASPFSCNWDILIKDWCQDKQKEDLNTQFYVLRDRVKLEALKCIINSPKSGRNVKESYRSDQISKFSSLFSNMNHNCLIPVRIESVKKGCPADHAIICIPNTDDLMQLKEKPSFQGPEEPIRIDSNVDQRKELHARHTKELKRLRKQRVKSYKKLKIHMETLLEKGESISHLVSVKRNKMPTKEVVDKYAKEMEQLWVPNAVCIKDSCSRSVVGFVCKGDFSLTEAHGIGLGYIPLPAVIHLITAWIDKPIVLFRNPNSLQYRYAYLKVC